MHHRTSEPGHLHPRNKHLFKNSVNFHEFHVNEVGAAAGEGDAAGKRGLGGIEYRQEIGRGREEG